MRLYPTDLTDSQWAKILVLCTKYAVENKFDNRKRQHSLREIMNGLLYLTKGGIQ